MSGRHLSSVGVVFLLAGLHLSSAAVCGGKVDLSTSGSGTVTSPNYPSAYPAWSRCIWLLQAPTEYQISLSITFQGESSSAHSGCGDYIEVREGSSSATELVAEECGTLSLTNVTSSGRWMWILFSSDGSGTAAGLTATYRPVYAGSSISNITSPIATCHFYARQCHNLECIPIAYLCDGYSDCGCSPGCDEDDCPTGIFSVWERVLLGLGTGVAAFLLVIIVIRLVEYWQRLQVERQREQEKLRQRFQKPLPLSRRGSRFSTGTPHSPLPDSPLPEKSPSTHLEIP